MKNINLSYNNMSGVMFPIILAAIDEPINLQNVPTQLAAAIGVPVFAAGILASLFLMMPFLLPIIVFSKKPQLPITIVGLSAMAFGVALGWFPIWLFAILILAIAVFFGKMFKDMI